ncbi:RNA-directed DNA polymerase from mobile element jockey [Eumeta japonica]|uniref:RNA-directed DNA polymerase from mobile element jockey n=1 Tax=Eumeta variegata TaxID=151549 RepID=A0A4C1U4Q4_EUMVA|nr:RNA-directed DNA polymerase from mobile element jockey [Eumeta japonica]
MLFCAIGGATGRNFQYLHPKLSLSRSMERSRHYRNSETGKPRDLPTSYRPISLLSGLGKYSRKSSNHDSPESLSTLSPLLYSAYTNDIPRPQTGVQLALFADDTALYLSGSNFRIITPRLQKAIDELTRWFQTWRIEVNPEKSAAIFFNYSRVKKKEVVPYNSPTFRINKSSIPWHHKYKYLGITLDKHLHFKDHIKRVRQNAQLYLSRLSSMIGKKSKMSLRNKCTLYKVCIRPVMTYAAPVFAHANPKALYQLQDMSKKFFDTAANHPNPLLQTAVSYEPPPPHHFIRRPRNVLSDPPDELTAEVERLTNINKDMTEL